MLGALTPVLEIRLGSSSVAFAVYAFIFPFEASLLQQDCSL